MKHHIIFSTFSCLLFFSLTTSAQFAPAAGQAGTTAMYKDSSAFIGWATKCKIVRGLQDISVTSGAYANVGDSASAYGIAGTTGVVSLGDGGYAIIQFNHPIMDGAGPDLAIFENSFSDTFLELAFVEASSDGVNYVRFPATSNTDETVQTGSFGTTDPTMINNFAGKYRSLYGTPFDLADIPGTALLNKQAITHIKIIDVVGCIQNQYCTRDMNNHKVNDPWPTAFGSGGFDLDAVGVIHQQAATSVNENNQSLVHLYPNPAKETVWVSTGLKHNYTAIITNVLGEEVFKVQASEEQLAISLTDFPTGIYTLTLLSDTTKLVTKFIKVD